MSSITQVRRRKLRSGVWKYFIRDNVQSTGRCQLCPLPTDIKIPSGCTTSLARHLVIYHGIVVNPDKRMSFTSDNTKQCMKQETKSKIKKKTDQGKPNIDFGTDPGKISSSASTTNNGLCLICNSSSMETLPSSVHLESNVKVYFVLKHVLELPCQHLEKYLKHSLNPQDWVKICAQCNNDFVRKCNAVFIELLEIKQRFAEARLEMIEAIRKSIETAGRSTLLADKRDIRGEIRQFVQLHNYGDLVAARRLEEDETVLPLLIPNVNSQSSSPILIKEEDQDQDAKSYEPDDCLNWNNDMTSSFISTNCGDEIESQNDFYKSTDAHSESVIAAKGQPERPSIKKRQKSIKQHSVRFTCTFEGCKEYFYMKKLLRRHRKNVHGIRKEIHPCHICGKQLMSKKSYNDHVKFLHEGIVRSRSFTCDICSIKFFRKESLRNHMKRRHNNSENKEKTATNNDGDNNTNHGTKRRIRKPLLHYCTECKRSFAYRDRLLRHMNRMHGKTETIIVAEDEEKQSFPCPKCDLVCATANSLRKHIQGVHEKKFTISCHFCGRTLSDRHSMKTHIRRIHKNGRGPSKLQCTMINCTQTFVSMSEMRTHILKKHKTRKIEYQCEFCEYNATLPSLLRRHIDAVHVNKDSKPFSCDECGRKFSIQKYLDTHKRRRHRPIKPLETHKEGIMFPCTVEGCTKTFKNAGARSAHIVFVHSNKEAPILQCDICGLIAKNGSNLNRHIKVVHMEKETKPYMCDECGKGFASPQYLKQHKRSHQRKNVEKT